MRYIYFYLFIYIFHCKKVFFSKKNFQYKTNVYFVYFVYKNNVYFVKNIFSKKHTCKNLIQRKETEGYFSDPIITKKDLFSNVQNR